MADNQNTNELELIRFEAKSFMGIDRSKAVVLDFSARGKKGKPVVILEGNQAVGKSSTLNAILYILGEELGFKKENITNKKDETVNVEFEFSKGEEKYRVKATKGKFTVELWNENHEVWTGISEPKAFLKRILGNIATDPMFLKELPGKKQIAWVRNNFSKEHTGPGRKSKEETLEAELAERTTARTSANRDYVRIKATVDSSDFAVGREQWEKKFKEPITVESAKASLQKATEDNTKLNNAKLQVKQLGETEVRLQNEIADLEQLLLAKQQDLTAAIQRKENGEKWIAENEKNITTSFKSATETFEDINNQAIQYNNWKRFLEDEKTMNEFESAVQQLDARKDEIKKELLTLTKKYLPKLDGLEVKVATEIDDKEEGIFYQGKTMAQVSESELWTIFLAICEHNGVNFVVLENINRLGSNAVAVLNELAAKGVRIFASEQNRKINSLKISFTDTIE